MTVAGGYQLLAVPSTEIGNGVSKNLLAIVGNGFVGYACRGEGVDRLTETGEYEGEYGGEDTLRE